MMFQAISAVYLVICMLCGQGDGTAAGVPQVSLAECESRARAIVETNPNATAFCTPDRAALDHQLAGLMAENHRLDRNLAQYLARSASTAYTPAGPVPLTEWQRRNAAPVSNPPATAYIAQHDGIATAPAQSH